METAVALRNEGSITVERAVEVFLNNQTSPQTRRAYQTDLRTWFNWLGSFEMLPNVEDAVNFKVWLVEKYKSRSAQRIFNTVKGFYRFLGVLNPFQNVKAPKTVKNRTPIVPEDHIVEKALQLAPTRDRLVLSLLLNGLRRSEVVSLTHESIVWAPEHGCDIIKVVGKGQKERLVPASKKTSIALRNFGFDPSKSKDGPLFPGMTDRTVEYVCRKWTEAAGKQYSPHKLRHHYGTRLARRKVPLLNLSKLMGHESVATTQIYTHLVLDDLVDAARLDPMDLEVMNA